jgi:hypothetical protein
MKDAQATGEASSLKCEHPALQKENLFFSVGFYAFLDPKPAPADQSMRIHADPQLGDLDTELLPLTVKLRQFFGDKNQKFIFEVP